MQQPSAVTERRLTGSRAVGQFPAAPLADQHVLSPINRAGCGQHGRARQVTLLRSAFCRREIASLRSHDSKLAKGCHREERTDEAIPVTNARLLRGFLPMAGDDLLGL